MSPHIHWSAGIGWALLGTTWAFPVRAQTQPALVINDVSVTETNSGSTTATFKVSFADTTPHGPVLVFFTTADGTATAGTPCGATGVDYVGVVAVGGVGASVNLSASEFSKAITITVCGDTRDEPNQTFFVNLTARGAPVQDGQGQGTIIDDDPPPVLSISDVTVTEGPAGATTTAGFGVTLTGSTDNVVRVTYTTVNGSALGGQCGTPGVDYEKKSASITFTNVVEESMVALAVVLVCGDDVSEGNQQFEVRLSNATNATIQDGTGLVTITDDEPLPTLTITQAVQVSEPSVLVPQVDAVFTVTLNGPPTEQPVSVAFATAPATALGGRACSPGVDYVTQSGALTFATARSTQQIRVPICLDSISDPNERFTVTLSNAANAVITQAVGTATIQ